jgi:hypothetical protein
MARLTVTNTHGFTPTDVERTNYCLSTCAYHRRSSRHGRPDRQEGGGSVPSSSSIGFIQQGPPLKRR